MAAQPGEPLYCVSGGPKPSRKEAASYKSEQRPTPGSGELPAQPFGRCQRWAQNLGCLLVAGLVVQPLPAAEGVGVGVGALHPPAATCPLLQPSLFPPAEPARPSDGRTDHKQPGSSLVVGAELVARAGNSRRHREFPPSARRSRSLTVSKARGRAGGLPGPPEAEAGAAGRRGRRGRRCGRRGRRGRAAGGPRARAVGGGAGRPPPQVLQEAGAHGGLQDAPGRQQAGQTSQAGAVALAVAVRGR